MSLLVLCTLGYSSAWAFDGHAIDINSDVPVDTGLIQHPSSDPASSQTNSPVADDAFSNPASDVHAEQLPLADVACDHCCHISAHLQAIFTQSGFLCSLYQSSELPEFSESFISFIVSPDLRPPRV